MLTGVWELDLTQSTPQGALLALMGRPAWQISVIDDASERFRLLHYRSEKNVHFIHKDVHIHLKSSALQILDKLFGSFRKVPFSEVRYSHWLYANGVEKHHEDDQKRFGPCESVTSWETDGPNTLTIRWKLSRGILHVSHSVIDDKLKVVMTFREKKRADGKESKTETATKIYNRRPLEKADLEFVESTFKNIPKQCFFEPI